MANKYLDLAGLQRLINKIKDLIPTKTSELNNDKGFITIEDIPGGETQITIRHQERFIVGTSSIFEFTKGYYTLNANSVNWYLDGIKQSNDTLIEIDNRTIEVVGGLPEGSTVVFDYVEYTNTVIGLEGVGVEYQWNGTELGVKREDEVNYQYTDLEGPQGPKGEPGPRGLPGTTSWNGITDKPSSFSPSTHTHTKSQVGLGSVDNIKQATKVEFDSHHSDTTKHILSTERTNWNAKETTTGSQNKANQAEQNAKDYTDGKVLTDVPLNAKFTDTIYTHPSTHPASMIVESATKRFVSDTEKTTWNAKASKSVATTLSDGLMASADKSKLNGIQAGAQVNTVTSVAGKTGAVTVTKSDVSLGSVLNYGLSTQLEAETGASNAKYMTPLRTKQAIDKQVADKNYVTQSELGDAGFGDMVKAVYDINNNGVVDNAEKVNGFTVGTNVPSNAKFTDTIYTHPSMHPASIITESTSRRFVSDTEKGQWNGKTKIITSATEPDLNTGDQWHKEI